MTETVLRSGGRQLARARGTSGAVAGLTGFNPSTVLVAPSASLNLTFFDERFDVIPGNVVSQLPSNYCGLGTASYLEGDHPNWPAASILTLEGCGWALDQPWPNVADAALIGAPACNVTLDQPSSDTASYAGSFFCNELVMAFAMQDLAKSDPLLALAMKFVGECRAQYQKPYIGLCVPTSPIPPNTLGAFTMTLGNPIPAFGEFGFTAIDAAGNQVGFPARIANAQKATDALDAILATTKNDTARALIQKIEQSLDRGDIANACYLLHSQYLNWSQTADVGSAFLKALDALNCPRRERT